MVFWKPTVDTLPKCVSLAHSAMCRLKFSFLRPCNRLKLYRTRTLFRRVYWQRTRTTRCSWRASLRTCKTFVRTTFLAWAELRCAASPSSYMRTAHTVFLLLNPAQVKIGIHSGPLTGGLIGRLRRFYRIFGDTVSPSENKVVGCALQSERFGTSSLCTNSCSFRST